MEVRTRIAVALVLAIAGCATTYHLPVEERSRSYREDPDTVWEACLAVLDDMGVAIVQAEREHGMIEGRSPGTFWALNGHRMRIVVIEMGGGRVRMDANAAAVSGEDHIDFGRAKDLVREFLEGMDARLVPAGAA